MLRPPSCMRTADGTRIAPLTAQTHAPSSSVVAMPRSAVSSAEGKWLGLFQPRGVGYITYSHSRSSTKAWRASHVS